MKFTQMRLDRSLLPDIFRGAKIANQLGDISNARNTAGLHQG
jgi:hypothetical protein